MALLWEDDSRAVGRSGLTVADYVTAAVEVLDAGGATGFSMRGVAERLGVRTMAAYSFGKKEDLLALAVDRTYRETYSARPEPATAHWRTGLTEIAHANRELQLTHPWLPELASPRSLMGPCEMLKRDLELRPLEATTLSDIDKDRILTQLLMHVSETTRIDNALRQERRTSGLSDEQWMRVVMSIAESVADPTRFPVAARVGVAAQAARGGVQGGREAFEFGLERLLDGFAVLVDDTGAREAEYRS
ncbi:TetR/AcrR family transcriptional regulator [Nocardia sienata]|uniref:TetR/AcrR family transcriptional regulator n=1 Tax=Nocardia sienata TaxID=248552 RepID=UPI001470E378|nr:TetR/AcrR family transcriptional regulator C-terminal domain-containing protein [Nocardia sienata]